MSTVHCPLCGLRFTYQSQLDFHAREDHVRRSSRRHRDREQPLPTPRQADDAALSADGASSAPS